MITKRTSVTAAVCGVALVASLTACSTGPSSGSADGELTVLSLMTKGTSSGDVFYTQVKKFEEESGVKVKVIDASQDIDQVFETSVAADSQADIIAVNLYDKTTSWIENGITLDVSDYAADWGVEDGWVPEAVSDWTTPDGQLRGFPYAGFSWPILYNTTLLKQAGVDGIPQTTDELIAAADKLRAAGITPWVNGGSDWNGAKLFSQFIQLYTDTDETKTLQSEGGYCASDDAMKGIDAFIEVRDGGVFVDNIQGYTVDMAQSDYFEGKAAIMSNASWMFSEIPDAVLEGTELGGLPLPDGAAADKPTIFQAYTGTGFMLSTKAESKIDDVEKFVKFFNEPATAESFVSDASSVLALADPAVSNAATNKLLKAAQSTLLDETQIAVLPDLQVPSAASANVDKAAAQAFGPGVDAKTICGALDAAPRGPPPPPRGGRGARPATASPRERSRRMTLVSAAPEAMTDEVATPPRRPSGRRGDSNTALLGIPAVVWYLFFMIGPLAAMFVISLLNWPSIIARGEFIGFENFTRLFQDAVFWTAFVNTMIQLVIVLPIMIPAAFMAGYYLSLRPRGGRILSVLFFTPGLISVSTKAMIFFGVLSPNGALNGLLQAVGLDDVVTAWLANPASALACIIVVDLWSGIGYTAVLFSARLSSVPGEVYEAAKLDGSSQWRIMWGIAFPMVKDFFGVATMLQFLWTLFNSATIVLLLTKGGPGTSSTTLSFFVYEKAFVSSQVGYSQAAGVIVFIIGLAGMALIRRSFRANY